MKILLSNIFILIAAFTSARADIIWEANYSEFNTQFSKWNAQNDSSIPKVIEENSILYFDGEPTT